MGAADAFFRGIVRVGVLNGGIKPRRVAYKKKKLLRLFRFLYAEQYMPHKTEVLFKIPQRPSLAFLFSFGGGARMSVVGERICRCRLLLLLLLLKAMGHRGPINACLLSPSLTARICFLLRFSEFKLKRSFIFAEHVRKKFLCYSTLIFFVCSRS